MSKRKPTPRQCTGKQAHTQTEAFKHLVALRKKDGAFGMNAYQCKICKWWHVGHRPRNRAGHR